MKKNLRLKRLFILLGILLPVFVVIIFGLMDIAKTWNTWGVQDDNSIIYPGWGYLLMLFFKFSLYFSPSFLFAIGLSIENKKSISKRKYLYYLLSSLNLWFLILLSIKLFSDSILELDRIFGFTVFSSIRDIQTLIGYILTLLLKQAIKVDPNKSFDSMNKEDFS